MRPDAVLLVMLCVAVPASACPCMDGLPAMGHGPLGFLPPQVESRPGCLPSAAVAGADAFGLAPVLQGAFDGPSGVSWQAWPALSPSPVRIQGDTIVVPPSPDGTALLANVRLDAEGWRWGAEFQMAGSGPGNEALGTGRWALLFLVVDESGAGARPGPRLDFEVDHLNGTDYNVEGGPAGLVIRDGLPHRVEVRQGPRELVVDLDGHRVSVTGPIGGPEECVMVAVAPGTSSSTLAIELDGIEAATLPDEMASLRRQAGYAAPALPLPMGDLEQAIDACSTAEYPCCAAVHMDDRSCAIECTNDGVLAIRHAPDHRVLAEAAHGVVEQAGCEPVAPVPVLAWASGPGHNETPRESEVPRSYRALRVTDTDSVMYDEGSNTRFSCDLIGDHILLEMEYTQDELDERGVLAQDLVLYHWDGKRMRPIDRPGQQETELGSLIVSAAGHDEANRTLWAMVRLQMDVEGRAVNNNFATVRLSDGRVEGNAYALAVAPDGKDSPGVGFAFTGALLLLAAVALRLRRP